MHWIDWLIMILPLAICACIAIYSRRFVRSVADFMAGGRSAGRFLVCAAKSEQGSGAAVFVASFQVFMVAGFTPGWWGQLSVPLGLLLMVTGWVVYRYRQTRAMTLGQFFEMRYSRRFRLFAGALGFLAGLINFGIIPAVGARFMVAFLNWPVHMDIGGLQVPTYLILMATFLTVCVIMTTTAGQVSVLLTDCAEGMFSQIFYSIIAVVLLVGVFSWIDTRAILVNTAPGKSLVNPFDTDQLKDFNIWYVLIGLVGMVYRTIAWQNSHAFNSSAANPHEARMGGILGRWRAFAVNVMVVLLSVCAVIYLDTHKASIDAALSQYTDPAIRDQMSAPVALTQMLPTGVKGMLLSICLMGIIAGDGIHLHSWGSIFIQDVMMPLRKKPLTPKQHIFWLRLSIVGVAAWAFMFGWLVPQIKYVAYWWGITEAIFVSGAGIAIIGGLYWKRGSTTAAWVAMILGSILACTGIGINYYYEKVLQKDWYVSILGRDIYMNMPLIGFIVTMIAVSAYFIISLLGNTNHNMDKLLNRGKYAVEVEAEIDTKAEAVKKPNWFYRVITFGVDEKFTRADRWITVSVTLWSMFWFAIFLVGCVAWMFFDIPKSIWADYWLWTAIYMPLGIGVVTTVWFTWGCTHDMVKFFKALSEERVDLNDDGTVTHDEGHPAMATTGGSEVTVPLDAEATAKKVH